LMARWLMLVLPEVASSTRFTSVQLKTSTLLCGVALLASSTAFCRLFSQSIMPWIAVVVGLVEVL
jgi:hypothetical protein